MPVPRAVEPVAREVKKVMDKITRKYSTKDVFPGHTSYSAFFDGAMLNGMKTTLRGFVSSEARAEYVDKHGNFFLWVETPNGPTFERSVGTMREANQAVLELSRLLRIHGVSPVEH